MSCVIRINQNLIKKIINSKTYKYKMKNIIQYMCNKRLK